MKIGTKLAIGFGIVVLVIVALGVTGFAMFARVSGDVTELSTHSLPAVKYSTNVERNAFECILAEKNYVLYEKDEIHQQAIKKLGELTASLDEVDKVAAAFKDEALGKKSKEVRAIAQEYGKLYDGGVAALKSNTSAEEVLNSTGTQVVGEASAYLDAKKSQYMDAKTALAVVNSIRSAALETRMNEKAYMLLKDGKYFEAIEKNIGDLMKCYATLETLKPDATEQKQIADARKATGDYFAAAKEWVRLQKETVTAEGVMTGKYAAVIGAANEYLKDKDRDYSEAKDAATKAVNFRLIAVGNTVLDDANAAMIHSKNYMLTSDPKEWAEVTGSIEKLMATYASIRKEATDEADRKSVEVAEKATQDYLAAAKAWVEADKQLKAAAATMDQCGQTVDDAARHYLAAKQGTTDKIADAVFIVANIRATALNTRLNEKGYIIHRDAKDWEGLNQRIGELGKLYTALKPVSLTAEDLARIDRASKATDAYLAAAQSWVNNDDQLQKKILPQMKQIGESVLATAQAAENDAWKASDARSAGVASTVATSKGIITIALLVGIVVGAVAAVVITRQITYPINQMVDRLRDIAEGEGDLTKRVDQDRKDELGELGKWFNTFVVKVHDIIAEVAGSASEVASASTQIASSSEEMATGMKEQSAQLTQMSSAVEEMSQSVVEVAKKSGDAANQAAEAGKTAQDGGRVVSETIDGMNGISMAVSSSAASVEELGKRGEQIGKIVDVINDIADQTNLLALNAAIEAARAGEHGRGFAVVADEVRKLADRTTKATEEIGQSIQAIQTETKGAVEKMTAGTEQVKAGVSKAQEAGSNLERIVANAQGVAGMVQSIAAAAEEQSAAAEQISKNIESINAVSKQATEGAGQAATAATQLSSKAEQLQRLVGRFKLART